MAQCKMPGRFSDRHDLKKRLRQANLHTVCEEAKCPNIAECFGSKTATFLIMGDTCTRNCRFCAVKKGLPLDTDPDEPARLADTVRQLGLSHVVITSVTRDDQPDGGAVSFVSCINEIKRLCPGVSIEVLVPDFKGNSASTQAVLDAGPHVFNHNIETIQRLYPQVRPQADFRRSLRLLSKAYGQIGSSMIVKSGLMVGLGETDQEVIELLEILKKTGCQLVTIGQYLQPTRYNIPVERKVTDRQFDLLRREGEKLGLLVVAGSLVRSSYRALELWNTVRNIHTLRI